MGTWLAVFDHNGDVAGSDFPASEPGLPILDTAGGEGRRDFLPKQIPSSIEVDMDKDDREKGHSTL